MMFVLSTVANNIFDASIVTSDRNGKSDDVIASSDQLEVVLADTSLAGSPVEEKFNLFEEAGFFLGGDGDSSVE